MKSRPSTPRRKRAMTRDHPSYTDRQLSEAMDARVINAVASNPTIWSQCAIIITYDETDGEWDHVAPHPLLWSKRTFLTALRVPLILISPSPRTHVVSHVEGDHNSVIETINYIFGLPALAAFQRSAGASGRQFFLLQRVYSRIGALRVSANIPGTKRYRDVDIEQPSIRLRSVPPERRRAASSGLPCYYFGLCCQLVSPLRRRWVRGHRGGPNRCKPDNRKRHSQRLQSAAEHLSHHFPLGRSDVWRPVAKRHGPGRKLV